MSCFATELQQAHNIPVYDVITPTCKSIVGSGARKVALLATRSTIANGAYQTLLADYGVHSVTFDCSAFVPYIEQCAVNSIACQRAVNKALNNLPDANVDAVILGCTHFPLLRRQIADYCDESKIIECSCSLPFDASISCNDNSAVTYFTTGDVDFANAAARCLNKGIRFERILLN